MLTDPTNTVDQTRSARLGYVTTSRSTLQGARQNLVHRRFRQALREGAKALHQYLLYLRAELSMRLRRGG
jgi:hypothetical protein